LVKFVKRHPECAEKIENTTNSSARKTYIHISMTFLIDHKRAAPYPFRPDRL
jgi:hypothetical protein